MSPADFTVGVADYRADFDALRAVREAVFIAEQGVPPARRSAPGAWCLPMPPLPATGTGRPTTRRPRASAGWRSLRIGAHGASVTPCCGR